MDLGPFAKKRKAGLTTTDGRASPRLVTYIKSLAAPFLVTQTGELCERFQLAPGAIYTLGRSKKACDIVFLDTRVSRQHCQLYMFPQNNAIALLDGAVPDAAIPRNQREKEKRRRFPAKENERLRAIDRRLRGTRIQGFKSEFPRKENKNSPEVAEISSRNEKVCAIDGLLEGTRIRDVNTEGPRERNLSVDLLFTSNRRRNRSLNGIFVNGNLIDSGSCRVLSLGDEVSLVGPTKAGQSLDMNCHVAVGFTVETEPSTKKAIFAGSSASIPSYERKRTTITEMVSDSSVDRLASATTLTVNADKVKDNKRKTPNLATHTEEKRAQRDSSVEGERLYCSSKLPEVDSQSGEMEIFVRADCGSKERCSGVKLKTDELGAELLLTPDHGKAETLDARDAGIPIGKVSSFPATIETFESTVTKKVRKTTETRETSNVSSEWLDLDNQLASTVNLIQASARLRSFVSDILNSYNTGNASKCQVELQLKKAKEECPARRDTSSLSEAVWALQTSRESLPESPLFLCGFASSLGKKVSDHPMWCPGNGTQSACRYISIGKPTLEKTEDASYDTEIEHQPKIRRSPPRFPPPLSRTVLTKEMHVDTEIKVSSCTELSICEERNSQLGAFEQLHEWSLCLGRATDDSRLSGKEFKTDLVASLTHLTRTSMAAETMIRDVQTDFSKGTLTSKTEPYAVVFQGDKYEPAVFTQSEFSDQGGFQDAPIAMLASYKEIEKEIGKNRPCNAGMSSAALEIFEIRNERHIFDSPQISAEGFPDKHRKRNSEIMPVSSVRSSGNSDDICPLISEDQIGEVEADVAKGRKVTEGKEISGREADHHKDICPLISEDQIGEVEADVAKGRKVAEGNEISGWEADHHKEPIDFLYSSSPTADDKELLTSQILCISALLDTAKDPDICSIDCNHLTSTTQQALQRSPVSRIVTLQNTSEMKDDSFVKDHSVKPVEGFQVNGNTGRNEGLCCALHDAETGSLSLCQVESAKLACCFRRSQESLPDVIEQAVLLCAPKLQSEPANYDLNRMLGAGIPTLHVNYKDDKLSVEICEGRDTQLQHAEDASRKHVNLEVDPCSTHISHILTNTISERALLKKDVDDDLIKSELHQMTSIALTNSACTVGHINQDDRHDGKLEWSERLQVRGACVDQGICLDSIINDHVGKDIKTEYLQDFQSLVERSRSSGYFLNQLKDVASEGSVSHTSISIKDLLSPVDDLDAVFIATFTYDLPWFLSFAGFSRDVPVTVACHDADRCWSQSREDRCERPYLDWPNVTLVYPPFPNACAFAKGSKRRGIGCHHPKLFLLRRKSSIRVIISSANLTPRQWFAVSNNVWCQDFPIRGTSDFMSLFQEGHSGSPKTADFALQLAAFIAALVFDFPSEAHWVPDLADFDFSSAAGSLVASVPGLHHPLYHNSPEFLISLEMGSSSHFQNGDSWSPKHLGVVNTAVVGINYRFCALADPKGIRIRALAAILNDASACVGLSMPVLLKRAKYVTADPNAVSVVVTSKAKGCSQDLFLQADLHNADIHTLESNTLQSEEDFVKLGFLPRDVASWLAVLCDRGFFSFAACIWAKEALSVASGQTNGVVKLALYVFQGPRFSELSTTLLNTKEVTAFCGLLKSLHRPWGLWRLEKVLSKYNWQDSEESDFFFGASAIGTSLDAKFLAAFAAASGRRAIPSTWSQESDPEWGCWTAGLEADNPSIGIVFPTIERVRKDNFAQFGLLCFAESAWERLKSAHFFYDAVPCSPEREGFPMHAKVARRRFQKSPSSRPYGWFYCGSHNFSPAAWGRPSCRPMDGEAATDAGMVLGSTLHIANYEIGIVLVDPPPPLTQQSILCNDKISEFENETERKGLDRFTMPFKMPPPKYKERDRPATGKAMHEAFMELKALELIRGEEDFALLHSEAPLEGEGNHGEAELLAEEEVNSKGEAEYVEALWSQIENAGN